MKLCIGYTIFNGLDLLEKSIEQICNEVDKIIICWQKISNKGNESNEIEVFIKRFNGNNKFHLLEFKPNLTLRTKENELNKHNLMLKTARDLNCTHFILSATDHYFRTDEFKKAKRIYLKENLSLSFTKMFTYYKKPEWQLIPIEDYVMPFIFTINEETKYVRYLKYPAHVDPSVQTTVTGKYRVFNEDEIMMHHYSMIRTDIREKFRNAAASIRWGAGAAENYAKEYENYSLENNTGISYFGNRKVKEVPNYFGL